MNSFICAGFPLLLYVHAKSSFHDSLQVGCVDFCFISSLLRWSYSISRPGLKPSSPSRLDVRLFRPASISSHVQHPRGFTPEPKWQLPSPARRPPTQPSRQDKQKNSLQEGLPPPQGRERGIPVCDARFCWCWQRNPHQIPKSPKFSLSPPPSCLTAHLDSVFIYRCSSKHPPLSPIRHRKHVMCVCVCKAAEAEKMYPARKRGHHSSETIQTRTTQILYTQSHIASMLIFTGFW